MTAGQPSEQIFQGADMDKILRLGLVVLMLAGCASPGPRVTTNINPATDFANFGSYNFMQPLGTDRDGGIQTPLSAMLMGALSRELESRGFKRSDNPDLLVNVFVVTEERMDVRQVPTASSFHGYRRNRYSTWGNYRTQIREYTRGTLAIDLIDAGQRMLAWEGVAQQRLGRNATQITQEQVDTAVGAVLAEFPHSAH
jgi:hypothetical protein